ncbi:MAG: amino acid synthesis family protein [Azospirillaceae bacterium]
MTIRRIHFVKERILGDGGAPADPPISRAAALVCLANPFAGQGHVEDLSPLFDAGRDAGRQVMAELTALLDRPAVTYGKAALVGLAGALEHGAACIHPKLGKPMRDGVGGGKAIIPSNCKRAPAGAAIDVPLGHKDDVWSFPHFDTITVTMPDAPAPDEIVLIIAVGDGGRPNPRVGSGPISD